MDKRREVKEWIITFGSNHLGGTGMYKYAIIHAEDENSARSIAYRNWGTQWSNIYSNKDFAGVDEFHLTPLENW
jgi:hypothetical protein